MLRNLSLAAAVFLCIPATAQTPDWATGVAPILYNHCTVCHHSGGIGPFSLLTYSDALAQAGPMRSYVSTGKMPPWPPDPSYSHLAHERLLSTSDINTIVNWVNGGTPQGTLSMAPPAPVYAPHTGMISGTPDLSVKIPVYTSTANANDVYQCFVIPSGLTADRFISSFEAVPGNPACVHHVLVFADTTGYCDSLQTANAAHGPGYPDFSGVGTSNASMIGVWVPGSSPMSYPPGFGLRLPAHSDIVVQVHYPAGTAGLTDSTEIHFFFTPTTSVREVFMEPVLYHGDALGAGDMTDGPLFIPADSVKTFHEEFDVPIAFTMLGAFPHMHLIGKSIESYVVHPPTAGGDTDRLIRINNWDFHWQGFYMFQKLKKVPGGSKLWARATYDNTSSNPNNPHSPPQNVTVGEQTTNEMMIVFFVFTFYMPGDENIIVDSALYQLPLKYYKGEQILDVYPNPSANDMIVKCYFEDADVGSMELTDMQGRVVKQYMREAPLSNGYNAYSYSVADLPAGSYTLTLKTRQNVLTHKVVVSH